MLTSKQKKWIEHLSDTDKIVIKPYDKTAPAKFEAVRKKIIKALGPIAVVHSGATSLKISGQDEIDIYIPVPKKNFNTLVVPLTKLFGQPKSFYEYERVRFVTHVGKKHIDVFLINKEDEGWKNGVRFERYLRKNPKALEEYRLLKENGKGLSVREYYRKKIIFINKILEIT